MRVNEHILLSGVLSAHLGDATNSHLNPWHHRPRSELVLGLVDGNHLNKVTRGALTEAKQARGLNAAKNAPTTLETNLGTSLGMIAGETQNNSEVVTQVGGTAVLRCYTHHLGDGLVSK